MKLHVLGACGTLMGGIARLAQELGHEVSGSDERVYPPMSAELADCGIELRQGYDPAWLDAPPDQVIVGNALSRGNPSVERLLSQKLSYTSGPQWLAQHVLPGRRTLAVSGTHGKTTTASILAWILQAAGKEPGFLIGGVPENFGRSARLGKPDVFVVEADEYDTAFFDKRSKFLHYRPDVLVIHNIEYDHADIFPNVEAILAQFHQLIRTIPGNGRIIARADSTRIDELLEMGCWSRVIRYGGPSATWQTRPLNDDYSEFVVMEGDTEVGRARWDLFGEHNAENALAAMLAAQQVGVPIAQACECLRGFKSVKRRLQRLARVRDVTVYDDFAHHPTAIARSLAALRGRVAGQRLIVALELRSNTMKAGVHKATLAAALAAADLVFVYQPASLRLDLRAELSELGDKLTLAATVGELVEQLARAGKRDDHIVIMSNGGFEQAHQRLLDRLAQ